MLSPGGLIQYLYVRFYRLVRQVEPTKTGQMSQPTPERVICYIDGFNLYFGLRQANWRRFFWLDVCKLAASLVGNNQVLVATKYFTARINGAHPTDSPQAGADREAKRLRQALYLDAIGTLPGIDIFEGHYLVKERKCKHCKTLGYVPEEKMTDVQIATELLADAFLDRFDVAFIVSADSDLVPPIRTIKNHFGATKTIVAAFPPKRFSSHLKQACDGYIVLGRGKFGGSLLPEDVPKQDGTTLKRPAHWT